MNYIVASVSDMPRWVSVLNVFNSALYVLCIIITVKMIDFVCNLDHQGWKSYREQFKGFPVCFICVVTASFYSLK